jgi:hypothetical protein
MARRNRSDIIVAISWIRVDRTNVLVGMRFLRNRDTAGRACVLVSKNVAHSAQLLESLLLGISELQRFFIIAHKKRFGNAFCSHVLQVLLRICCGKAQADCT